MEELRLAALAGTSWIPTSLGRLPLTRAAIVYAEQMHAGQRRPDGTAFILHPLEVASLLYRAGAPDHLVAAGVLHDLIEKTSTTAEELQARFEDDVTGLVLSVSDDDRISRYGARKAALRRQVAAAGEEALTLFAADKLSRLRELSRETARDRDPRSGRGRSRELRARRLRHYQRSLSLLEERLPESQLVRDLRTELEAYLRVRTTLAARH